MLLILLQGINQELYQLYDFYVAVSIHLLISCDEPLNIYHL